QREYTQGFTTELPSEADLEQYRARGYSGTSRDYSSYLAVLDALGATAGQRLLDFGCSWGYGSWQLRQHGFEVQSFEISQPRAQFAGGKLGLSVHSRMLDLSGPIDIFFSSHVLEHVPSVAKALNLGISLLKPNGLFVAFTPNGSAAHRGRDPYVWHKL